MSVSMIADIVTIVTFVSGVGLATKASVSKRSEEWIRSLIINCLDDYFGLHKKLSWKLPRLRVQIS